MRAVGVMDFAGGFACGVEQAGFDYVAKREPSAFGGFGVAAVEANFHEVQVEVNEAEFWSVVQADMVFGCPPCSGFSMLSTINTADSKTGKVGADGVRVAQRGVDSPDNKWMTELVHFAGKIAPPVIVFESVRSGGVLGAPLMRQLWQMLREETGLDYHMTDVFMNAAFVGGDVIRPRYFFVAHLRPFGVDVPTARPRALMEVIGDLPLEAGYRLDEGADLEWGHVTNGSASDERIRQTIELFRTEGYDWTQGKRLPEHLRTWVEELKHDWPEWWRGRDGELLSHAVSDNMYSPFRWRANDPMGVVTGGFMDRAVHPVAARTFTYREGARFMGLPDDWNLRPIVAGKKDPWLGKAIPVSSGRWISTWAAASIDGSPGEYAGALVEPKHRVIDVSSTAKIEGVLRGRDEPTWWPEPARPRTYHYSVGPTSEETYRTGQARPASVRPAGHRTVRAKAPRTRGATPKEPRTYATRIIERIPPEDVLAFIESVGLRKFDAAQALGVSPSRINEITTRSRPKSWLNADRWDEVRETLTQYERPMTAETSG